MNDIEEAISYIKNTKKHLLHLGETWYADYLDDAIELLKSQPEIIRCKDCKHQNWVNAETGCIVCKFGRGANAPDWFCAYGEVKGDG